jgi:hypothetical protein
MENSDDDQVGYGKPPKRNQFKKGQSGNPSGRPKKPKSFERSMTEALFIEHDVKINGRTAL